MVQAIGVSGRSIDGRKLIRLMRERRGLHSFGNDLSSVVDVASKARMNGHVTESRLLFDDSYLGRAYRPKLLLTAEVDDLALLDSGEHGVEYMRMAPDTGLNVTLLHELSNMEIKALIDSGLYDDVNYERVFNKAMSTLGVTFEADTDMSLLLDTNQEGLPLAFGVVSVQNVVQDTKESTINSVLRDGLSVVTEYYANENELEDVAPEHDRDQEVFLYDDVDVSHKLKHTLDLSFSDVSLKTEPVVVDLDLDREIVLPKRQRAMPVIVGDSREDTSIRALHENLKRTLSGKQSTTSSGTKHTYAEESDDLAF